MGGIILERNFIFIFYSISDQKWTGGPVLIIHGFGGETAGDAECVQLSQSRLSEQGRNALAGR